MRRHAEKTGRTPPALESKPEIPESLIFYWEDFFRLSRSRRYEQGQPLPLHFELLNAYCKRYGPHDLMEFDRYLKIMEEIDNAFLETAIKRS